MAVALGQILNYMANMEPISVTILSQDIIISDLTPLFRDTLG